MKDPGTVKPLRSNYSQRRSKLTRACNRRFKLSYRRRESLRSARNKCHGASQSVTSSGGQAQLQTSTQTAVPSNAGERHGVPCELKGQGQRMGGVVVDHHHIAKGSKRIPVTLFRQPSEPLASDLYHTALGSSGEYTPGSIAVLQQVFVGMGELVRVVRDGPGSWAGVIATSTRAGEAWQEAARQVNRGAVGVSGDWSRLPLFTPGFTTAEPFENHRLPPSLFPKLFPSIREHPPGSAARLADLILSHTPVSSSPFLFVTGDKTLPELPTRLRDGGRHVTERQVYRTGERDGLLADLRENFGGIKEGRGWLAFFAPSSAKIVLDHLHDLGVPLSTSISPTSNYRLAAIGQTTATYLESRGLVVAATASQPTPAGLLKALQDADNSP